MILDLILIVALIVLVPTVAWLAVDTWRLRRDVDDAYLLIDDHDRRISDMEDQVETASETVSAPEGEDDDLPVPDVDEQLDVPDYDAPTTPTYRQENTNA